MMTESNNKNYPQIQESISSEIVGLSTDNSEHEIPLPSIETTHRLDTDLSLPIAKPPSTSSVCDSNTNKKKKREICHQCQRPKLRACLCPWVPDQPLPLVNTCIVVLQHPHEFKHKSNRSVPLLALCLSQPPLYLCVGRRVGEQLPAEVQTLLQPPNLPILIFPPLKEEIQFETESSSTSSSSRVLSLTQIQEKVDEWRRQQQQEPLDKNVASQPKVVLLVLDATWKFAKEMHRSNKDHYPSHMLRMALQGPTDLPPNFQPRRFEIRTTPSSDQDDTASASWMCTAECVAWITAQLEQSSQPGNRIYESVLQLMDAAVEQHNSFVADNKRSRTHGSSETGLPQSKKRESKNVP